MFELFLPYVIGTALGIEPTVEEAVIADTAVVEDAGQMARTPEPQIPTGKFTTAVEVKPILGATKGSWVAVRDYNGQDLVYFTHLMSWRCGLWDVKYGLNGAAADQVIALEPCHEDTAAANAMTDIENFPIYLTMPPGSVQSISVLITYDDGSTEAGEFERNAVLIP